MYAPLSCVTLRPSFSRSGVLKMLTITVCPGIVARAIRIATPSITQP